MTFFFFSCRFRDYKMTGSGGGGKTAENSFSTRTGGFFTLFSPSFNNIVTGEHRVIYYRPPYPKKANVFMFLIFIVFVWQFSRNVENEHHARSCIIDNYYYGNRNRTLNTSNDTMFLDCFVRCTE